MENAGAELQGLHPVVDKFPPIWHFAPQLVAARHFGPVSDALTEILVARFQQQAVLGSGGVSEDHGLGQVH